ncbi:MAG TPA: hypothetical protein VF189_05305 [Patescibacteria group bacterium]
MANILERAVTKRFHKHLRPSQLDTIKGAHANLKAQTGLGKDEHEDLESGHFFKTLKHGSNIAEEGLQIAEKVPVKGAKVLAQGLLGCALPGFLAAPLIVADAVRFVTNVPFKNPILEGAFTGWEAVLIDLGVIAAGYILGPVLAIRKTIKSVNELRAEHEETIRKEVNATVGSIKDTPAWVGNQVEDTKDKLGQVKGQVVDTRKRLLGR